MAEIRVGKPDVTPDRFSHVEGVRQGNSKRNYESQMGVNPDGTADSRRSTGISPKHHNPILPIMPNIPPG